MRCSQAAEKLYLRRNRLQDVNIYTEARLAPEQSAPSDWGEFHGGPDDELGAGTI